MIGMMSGSIALQAQDVLTPELLWKLGRVSEPSVSPDGKSIVYSVKYFNVAENKGFSDLYSIPVAGGDAKKITDFKGNESNPRWRPDGKKIGFIAEEGGSEQFWEMNPDGSDKQQITKIDGGISNFNYAPNQSRIYFTRDVQIDKTLKTIYPDLPKANARLITGLMYRHWTTWEDGAYSHVFYADYADGKLASKPKDIMPGEAYDSPLAPMGGEEQLNFSPDGKRIAYTCKKLKGTEYAMSTNSEIYIYDSETEKTENITEGNFGYDTEPCFAPDGKSIVWLSMERPGYESDRNRIFFYDFATKTKKELTKGFDQNAANLRWSKDAKTLYFMSGIQATEHIYSLDIKSGKIRKITSGNFDYQNFELAEDGKNTLIVSTRMDISHPTEIFRIDAKTGEATAITNTNKEILANIKMGKVEKRMVKATDGKEILNWVIYPPDFDPAKKYPTLLYCQGGPQSTVSQFFSYRWNFQLMAANGYIVVAPNRRGLPSFGQEWNDQITEDWGGQAMKDMLSSIDDVSKETYVDKDRRAAVGASFGGFAVYWLAGNHQKRFKSFIAHCGVFNFESMYGTTEETFFNNHDFGGAYWQTPQPKSYKEFSPHQFVKKWDTPVLVIHNEKDFRVPLEQGMQAFTAAQLQGIKSEFLYFEDEGHWVMKPQNGILWQRVFFNWLKETLN